MPPSRVSKSRMFREFSKMSKRFLSHEGLKYMLRTLDYYNRNKITTPQIAFMMWAYDLEFFTIDHAVKESGRSKEKFQKTILYPLKNKGYVYKHFDKLSPSQTREDHIFRDETKWNYRDRFALTQKARMQVSIIYRMFNGTIKSDSSAPLEH